MTNGDPTRILEGDLVWFKCAGHDQNQLVKVVSFPASAEGCWIFEEGTGQNKYTLMAHGPIVIRKPHQIATVHLG
jgi:hypothetical protein